MENKYEYKSLMDVLSSSKEKIENVRRTLGTLQKELSDYYLSSVQNTDGIPESQKEAMASMRLLLNDALGNLSNSVKSVKALTGEKEEKVEEKKYPLLNEVVKTQMEDSDSMFIFQHGDNYVIFGEKGELAAKVLDKEIWLNDVTIGTKTDKALSLPSFLIDDFLSQFEANGIDVKIQKSDGSFEERKSTIKKITDILKNNGYFTPESLYKEYSGDLAEGLNSLPDVSCFTIHPSIYGTPLVTLYDTKEDLSRGFSPYFFADLDSETRNEVANKILNTLVTEKQNDLPISEQDKREIISEKAIEQENKKIFFEKYNGKDYPARLVNINGEDLKVASEELNEVLRNTTYQEYIDAEARQIGEDIYYFVPAEKLYLPEEELVSYVKNTMRNEKLLYSTLAQESLFEKVMEVPEEIKADFKGKISAPHYVVFDNSFPLKPCFYYSYNDAAENASYPTKKSQIPDNFFEKINKRLNSSEPIRYYLPSVDIPVYAVKALTDGKLDGLTEKEKKDISAYIGKTGAGIIYARNEIDKPIHLPFPAFGPAADCQVLDRYVNVVPRELKDVYVSDDGRLHPKKYTMNPNYDGTFNIVLLHDIGNIPTLKKGEIGGVIHSEKNLSHEGRCWVFPGGEVSGQARVEGNAFVEDGGKVEVFAKVEDAATVYGRVGGNSKISGDTVVERSEIIGYDPALDNFRQGEAEDIGEAENIHRGR